MVDEVKPEHFSTQFRFDEPGADATSVQYDEAVQFPSLSVEHLGRQLPNVLVAQKHSPTKSHEAASSAAHLNMHAS